MRLEINIPDSTKPEYKHKLASLTELLSSNPELVADIHLNRDTEDAAIQAMFTPALLAEVEAADAENFLTADQLDNHFKRKSDAWALQHRL